MLFFVCQCGVLLANKEYEYEKNITEFCSKNGIDESSKDPRLAEFKQKQVNSLCRRSCCKMNLLTYVDIVKLIGKKK